MSKICEKCGNIIPDGLDTCPTCGRQDDEAIEAVMSDLADIFDGLDSDITETQDTAPGKKQKTAKKLSTEETAGGDTLLFDTDAIEKVLRDKTHSGSKAKEAQSHKHTSDQNKQTSRGKNTQKSKKKKKKKDSSRALLGIVIGMIVVLIVIAAAAVGMLYKMGFFNTMTDDELLGTTQTTQEVVSEAPAVQTILPETSFEEDTPEVTEASVAEEASYAEESAPVETEASDIQCDKFNLTGSDDMTFFSRGETAEIVYVVSPSEAESEIQWESSDETVATVSAYGVITARRGGNCTITGTCGDKSVEISVICDFTVPSTVLDMNYEDVTLDHEGQTLELSIDYELTDDQIDSTVWESSDEAVATVDDEGLVTAVADGTAVITASIGDYTASCIVRCVNVTGNKGVNSEDSPYVINYEDVTLSKKGEYFQLTLKSVDGSDVPDFTWKSSDTAVAKVDSKGVVTAVANGTCKITTTVDGDDFECIVRVSIKSE